MMKDIPMRTLMAATALAVCCAMTPAAQAPGPSTFATPEQAVDAMIKAAASGAPALLTLLGPDGKDLVSTGDAVQDQRDRDDFVRLAKEKATLVQGPGHSQSGGAVDRQRRLPDGDSADRGQRQVDVERGRRPLRDCSFAGLARTSSTRSPSAAVTSTRSRNTPPPIPTRRARFSTRNASSARPGKRDGLFWVSEAGGPESPIGEAIARAIAQGYTSKSEPYHGYFFKVLTAQGSAAPLGAMDFVVRGKMIGGFALVAWPAQYRVTGVQTFIVSHDGIVYQQDLGADTTKIASAMTRYDPGKGWIVTEDDPQ